MNYYGTVDEADAFIAQGKADVVEMGRANLAWARINKQVNYVNHSTLFQFRTASFSSFGGLTGKEQENGANSMAFTGRNLPKAGSTHSEANYMQQGR